jgi:acetyl-CoA C-acetyltransferase/acetyl-CoA acyltransferase
VITSGNASQLSDGASACLVMNGKLAEQLGLQPLGIYRGVAVAGNAPEENGHWSCPRDPQLAQAQWPEGRGH